MDAREETLTHLNRFWFKLQNLPNIHPAEQAAFFFILVFICESRLFDTTLFFPRTLWTWISYNLLSSAVMVLTLTVLTCVNYCCCCCRKRKRNNVWTCSSQARWIRTPECLRGQLKKDFLQISRERLLQNKEKAHTSCQCNKQGVFSRCPAAEQQAAKHTC